MRKTQHSSSHPWHDLPIGEKAPAEVHAVIEIPAKSKVKYELDKDTGFIPQTLCEDQDPLDVLVMMQEPVVPMCFMRVRCIGVMHMIDQGEQDDKIIAVHIDDPEYKHITDISQVPKHRLAEIRRFFEDYKKNENKEVQVDDIFGAEEAHKAVKDAMDLYQDQYVPKQLR